MEGSCIGAEYNFRDRLHNPVYALATMHRKKSGDRRFASSHKAPAKPKLQDQTASLELVIIPPPEQSTWLPAPESLFIHIHNLLLDIQPPLQILAPRLQRLLFEAHGSHAALENEHAEVRVVGDEDAEHGEEDIADPLSAVSASERRVIAITAGVRGGGAQREALW